MFGRWEALTALAIVAFEPNLIGHGSIVTTDMAISATSFGAIMRCTGSERTEHGFAFRWPVWHSVWMLSSKHSAVIFVGMLFVLLIADTVLFRQSAMHLSHRIIRRIAAFAGMFVFGLAILWSFYGFRHYAIPNATERSISVADYIKENGRPESVQSVARYRCY